MSDELQEPTSSQSVLMAVGTLAMCTTLLLLIASFWWCGAVAAAPQCAVLTCVNGSGWRMPRHWSPRLTASGGISCAGRRALLGADPPRSSSPSLT